MVWARRIIQTLCLILFLGLIWLAAQNSENAAGPGLDIFFHFDPLMAAGTWLSAHQLPPVFALALVTLLATILLGRVFCGWICPLGAINHAVTWLRPRAGKAKDAFSVWQCPKYYLLAALIVMAIFGANLIGVFDPLSLTYRAVTTALYPASQYAIEEASTTVYQADPRLGPLCATAVTEPVYTFFRDNVFMKERGQFIGAGILVAFFLTAVLLNLYKPRFWCRYICPLGALLGLCSKRPALRISHSSDCTQCGRCAIACPAAADPDKPGHWQPAECYACWNCIPACNREAIHYSFKSPFTAPTHAKLDVSKRAMLVAGAGGVGALLMLRLTPEAQGKTFTPGLIRPPGARAERDFLQRCVKCGLCMQACPTNALHPTTLQAGLEGIWTPMLVPKLGYCEYACTLCGQVCPTQAIQNLPVEEKKTTKIGLAAFDKNRCLPYAYERECLICEEHCPLPKKAIYFVPTELKTRDGGTVTLKQPRVDPALCIGCGICENVCVFKDIAAIHVTSAGETRHEPNRPILQDPWQDSSSFNTNNPYSEG